MRRFLLILFLLAAILLTSCGQAATPAASPTEAAKPTSAVPTQDPNAVAMECNVVSTRPTQEPTLQSAFPLPTEEDWKHGAENPALTIVEYSDFQCPYCSMLGPELNALVEKYPDDVQVVFRHFPLPSHALAPAAAQAAEAAGSQGKFWEMHDILFAKQATWSGMDAAQFNTWLVEQARELELDEAKFTTDLNSEAIVKKVKDAQEHGINIGIPGTPFLTLNGQIYQGPRDQASFETILNLFMLEKRQFTYCPPMIVDPGKQYTATIKTEKGDIVMELYPDKAPMAVNNFVFLARQDWYDNVTFHRVMRTPEFSEDFVAQAGDPSGSGMGGPGYTFADEISDLRFDQPGVVGMANAGPGSNGSQFFITYVSRDDLTGTYTVFGQVIEGMDVLKQLTPRDPGQQMGLPPGDKILDVVITEK